MKRLRRHCLTILSIGLLSSVSSRADIVVLKSGEKIDGKILSEDASSLTIEYQLTPKIKDKKLLSKTDIKEVTRFTPSQTEILERGLRKLLPSRDLMTPSDYEVIIQDELRTFIAKHPGTPEAKEVEEMISTLSDEKAKVAAGQVKMEGQWLDELGAKREAYNIEAYRKRVAMKAKVADTNENNLRDALREFDGLRAQFPASPQYVAAIPEAIEILDKYEKRLAALAAEQPQLKARQENGLKGLTGTDLQNTRAAINQEERSFQATYDAEKKDKVKWRSVSKLDAVSLKDALLVTAKEKQELRNLNLDLLKTEVDTLNSAIRALAVSDVTAADAALGVLRPARTTLINKTEFAKREKELQTLQAKARAELRASKVTASTAPEAPAVGTAEDNPLAAEMKAKAEEKKEKEKKAAEKKEQDRKARAEAAAKAAASASQEEEPGLMEQINGYIPIVGGVLLVVLVITMVMGKKKKEED
ncbi:MAG: PTPDL family protein [Roseimicrobium sp.]